MPVRGIRAATASALLVLVLASACSDDPQDDAGSPGGPAGSATPVAGDAEAAAAEQEPGTLRLAACEGDEAQAFRCGSLVVPLDHGDPDGDTLALPVIVQQGSDDLPVLLNLTGGPGQPGVSFAPDHLERMAGALGGWRLVMFDQRGTGGTAIDCPGLQAEMGWSDLVTPSEAAVGQCSDFLADDRAFYGTEDTVADIDLLREALGQDALAVSGTSYGSFVGSRYAVTHPDRVSHLVLDSVVPQEWSTAGSLQLANIRGYRRVLEMACRESRCTTDPLADIATLLERGQDGPELMNLLAVVSVVEGTDMSWLPDMLHQAVTGDRRWLDGWLDGIAEDPAVADYSAGLHAATLCLDQQRLPWGGSDAPVAGREDAVERVAARLDPADTYPFRPEDVVAQGMLAECVEWGATPPDDVVDTRELTVPTLFLIGDHDLSTSLEWAREQLRVTPDKDVLIVEGVGHSVQSHAGEFPQVVTRVREFLAR